MRKIDAAAHGGRPGGISAGSIAIDGRIVNNVPTRLRDIAMVFQSYALHPHMSVFENMAFSLRGSARSVALSHDQRR
jgi:multiple sugar transport system ATP-binding protein